MFKNKELVTGAKVGGAIAVITTMVCCLMSLLTITLIVSKIHINYACTVVTSEQLDENRIGFRTCSYLGNIRPKSVMGQPIFNNLNVHYDFIIAIVMFWVIFYMILTVSIPQYHQSWNLLHGILDSMAKKENLNELQRSLVTTWDYQELQIILISIEFFMLIFSYVTSCYNEQGKMAFDIAWEILSKVIMGRVICCCLVIGYFFELLITFKRLGGHLAELSQPVRRLLEKEFQLKLEKVEKEMTSDLSFIA